MDQEQPSLGRKLLALIKEVTLQKAANRTLKKYRTHFFLLYLKKWLI